MAKYEQVRVARDSKVRGARSVAGGWLVGLFAVGVVALAGCGEDDSGPASCTLDDQCSSGLVCVEGACTAVPCGSVADCLNGDQGCIAVNSGNFCSAVECGCANCPQCPLGETCNNGTCGAPSTCGPTAPCAGTDVCDNGTCRPCQGAECGGTDCTVSGCDNGEQCNTTTKQCEPVTGPTAEGCDTCANATECGDGWKCAPLPTGNACLPPCTTGDDCETGWICQTGNCTPASFRCDGCVTAGCPSGDACNPGNNQCVDAAPNCGSCGNDWECGDGNACHNNECQQRCDDGVCPSGGSCVTNARGVSVCDKSCAAACTPACSGATPICNNGTCVQCRTSNDCQTGQTCDTASNLCTGSGQCTAPTPILWQGQCVQCVTNNDCPGGQACATATNTCTSSQCAACAAPYPACVTIGTDSYCVQCAVDADCGVGGTCNTQTYACEGGTVTPTEKCTSDADCDAGASGFDLRCDVPSGYCYDLAGSCDNVTAFCVGTNGAIEKCVSILEIFGGGLGGSLPPEFSGGGTIPGFCGCSYTDPNNPFSGANCRSGQCIDFTALLALLGGGSAPSGAPNAVCFNLGF